MDPAPSAPREIVHMPLPQAQEQLTAGAVSCHAVPCCAESVVPYAEWYFCNVAPHNILLRSLYIVSPEIWTVLCASTNKPQQQRHTAATAAACASCSNGVSHVTAAAAAVAAVVVWLWGSRQKARWCTAH
jgi:hypothetical protein